MRECSEVYMNMPHTGCENIL